MTDTGSLLVIKNAAGEIGCFPNTKEGWAEMVRIHGPQVE